MTWKSYLIQLATLILLSWLAGQYFSQHDHQELQPSTISCTEELAKLNQRLVHLEREVKQMSTVPLSIGPSNLPEKENGNQEKLLVQLSGRVAALEAFEQKMQKLVTTLRKVQQAQPEPFRVQNWMATLPVEKRAEVEAAYREQADLMQKAIPVTPDAPPPNPDEMLRLIKESRESLNLKLKNILNTDEYQAFLDSLDEADIPLGLPLLEK
jgi:hypothetical protein